VSDTTGDAQRFAAGNIKSLELSLFITIVIVVFYNKSQQIKVICGKQKQIKVNRSNLR